MTENMNDVNEIDTIEDAPEAASAEVYEIAFHLLPTVAEEALIDEVNVIVEALKKHNVEMVGERFPAKIPLAYTMEKKIDGSIQRFSEGYFGWIAGALSKDAIADVKAVLDTHPNILRYLITKTSRDAVAAIMSDPTLDIASARRESEEGGEVSEEALDEALDAIAEEDGETEEKAA